MLLFFFIEINKIVLYSILGVPFSCLTRNELIDICSDVIDQKSSLTIVTPNPEIVVRAYRNKDYLETVQACDIHLVDGVGVQMALFLKYRTWFTRMTGVDTLINLAQICAEKKQVMVFIGGVGDVAQRAAKHIQQDVGENLQIYTFNPGQHIDARLDTVISEIQGYIKRVKPNVIAFGLGAGIQEHIMCSKEITANFKGIMIGVGGAFDMIAGDIPRAPRIMRACGFEWLWRLCQQPWRIKRIMTATIVFPLLFFRDRIFALVKHKNDQL